MSTVLKENYLNKWIWIELIGFDNQKPDFGVGDYISRCGFLPDGFVLLLYWTGFVVDHQGLDLEYELSPAEASYGAHEYSPERRRQTWTNLQLKRLIDTMHSYGCKVYLSFFNMCSYYNDVGELIEHEFYKDKNYLMETVRNAVRHGTISMLKRLPDGSFFEDFLQEKTVKALADYGFDGLQIADGISSPRIALQEGDYSDEIIDQFLEYSNIRLPDKLEALCDDNKELMNLRSDFIWQEHRLEWLKFHTFRWEQFFTKFISRLENLGKEAIFNSAWTRDPFEAIYRYGVDYRKIGKTGIKGCMVEDVSAGLAILSSHDNAYLMDDEQRKKIHYEFLTALMLNRAAMPEIKIIPLAGIHDTMEQWGVLEHMPTSMTRNVISNLNTYIISKDGIKSVTDGPFFCLGDNLSSSDWNFIRRNWDVGYTRLPKKVFGVTLVWSDKKLDREIEDFISFRTTPTHRLVSELMYAGAPICCVVRIEDLRYASGPILVTNPDLLCDEELDMVLSYENGDVLFIGIDEKQLPDGYKDKTIVCEKNGFGGMKLSAKQNATSINEANIRETNINEANISETNINEFNANETNTKGININAIEIQNNSVYSFNPKLSHEPVNALWTHPLSFAPISKEFFSKCASYIIEISESPFIEKETTQEATCYNPCKCISVKTENDALRVFVSNDDYYYNHPKINVRRRIRDVKCLTKYHGYKVDFTDTCFTSRIPGRGMEIFEIITEE